MVVCPGPSGRSNFLFRVFFAPALFCSRADRFNFQSRQFSPVPDGAVITFSPFEFVSDDLFVLALLDHFRCDFCPVDRSAMGEVVAVGMHQNLGNYYLLARLGLE